MAGAKLRNLKQAVRWVIDHLDPEDRIAITLFDDEVHPLAPSTRVGDAGPLLAKVEAIREAGGTAMSKGLLVGLDEARKGAGGQAAHDQETESGVSRQDRGAATEGRAAPGRSWVSRI